MVIDNWLSNNQGAGIRAVQGTGSSTFTANRMEWNRGGNMVVRDAWGWNITRMFELNVTDGNFYTKAPPGRIQNVRLKNIQWEKSCPILITDHNAEHLVEDVVFEGCTVAGTPLSAAQIQTNAFTGKIVIHQK
jgi:hypothetical protein